MSLPLQSKPGSSSGRAFVPSSCFPSQKTSALVIPDIAPAKCPSHEICGNTVCGNMYQTMPPYKNTTISDKAIMERWRFITPAKNTNITMAYMIPEHPTCQAGRPITHSIVPVSTHIETKDLPAICLYCKKINTERNKKAGVLAMICSKSEWTNGIVIMPARDTALRGYMPNALKS